MTGITSGVPCGAYYSLDDAPGLKAMRMLLPLQNRPSERVLLDRRRSANHLPQVVLTLKDCRKRVRSPRIDAFRGRQVMRPAQSQLNFSTFHRKSFTTLRFCSVNKIGLQHVYIADMSKPSRGSGSRIHHNSWCASVCTECCHPRCHPSLSSHLPLTIHKSMPAPNVNIDLPLKMIIHATSRIQYASVCKCLLCHSSWMPCMPLLMVSS